MKEGSLHAVPPHVSVERVETLTERDIASLSEATIAALSDSSSFTIGFPRTDVPIEDWLQSYWRGVMMVPERRLFVGKLDRVITGSIQLVAPSPSNQTSAFAGVVEHHFVAPWARGHGLARELLKSVEEDAREIGLTMLKLSVRANQPAAIHLYETSGYRRWGTLDKYEMVNGQMVGGHFYYKDI